MPLFPDRPTDGELATLDGRYAPIDSPTFTTDVVVPAISGANQAAQVTAYTATTGRLAIGGVEMGDTGWRDITSLCKAGTISASNTGFLKIRRIGNIVHMAFADLLLEPGTGILAILDGAGSNQIPTGFQPMHTFVAGFAFRSNDATARSNISVYASVAVSWTSETTTTTGAFSQARPAVGIYGEISWTTSNAWPVSLPGTAA